MPVPLLRRNAAEDSGYLVTFLYYEESKTSSFYVIDATTMQAVAALALPQRVPFGFHGWWASQEELRAQQQ